MGIIRLTLLGSLLLPFVACTMSGNRGTMTNGPASFGGLADPTGGTGSSGVPTKLTQLPPSSGDAYPGSAPKLADGYTQGAASLSQMTQGMEDPKEIEAIRTGANLFSQMGGLYQGLGRISSDDLKGLTSWIQQRANANTELERAARLAAEAKLTWLESYLTQLQKRKDVFWFLSTKYGHHKNLYITDLAPAMGVIVKDEYKFIQRGFSVYTEAMTLPDGATANLSLIHCYLADGRTSGVYSFYWDTAQANCSGGTPIGPVGYTASSKTSFSSPLQIHRARFFVGSDLKNDWILAPYPNWVLSLGWIDDGLLGFPTP